MADSPDSVWRIEVSCPLQVELAPILDRTAVYFIHGNHDTDSDPDYDNLFGSELADRNLHGRIVELAGYKVAGLGGIFRGKIWDPRRPVEEAASFSADALRRSMRPEERWRDGIARRHRSTIFPEERTIGSISTGSSVVIERVATIASPGLCACDWQVNRSCLHSAKIGIFTSQETTSEQ
ncbi:hypothetical protein QFZ83_006401 [Variovorax sp. W1I1]|uniref:hypothetical protein n=1 Tax=Variovorax sp. W1I1 TaxID=3042309 RepID=UPI0027867CE9|nr:hypothetical protein [Variovorax sp. W1I1]MDQ0612230.1 hypothetical protein [Variovorax sp. W1I1]